MALGKESEFIKISPPDTSVPVEAYAVKERGESFLRLVQKVRDKPEDLKISEIRNNVEPAFVFYRLGAGRPLNHHLLGHSQEEMAVTRSAGRDALVNTYMLMTENGISLVHKNHDIFVIDKGMPFVTTTNSEESHYAFNAQNETFVYGYMYRPPTRSLTSLVKLIMVYDLSNIKKAYSGGMRYGSKEFYDTVRDGLFVQIDVTPVTRR